MRHALIVGAGGIAQHHLSALRRVPGVETAGICDLSPATAEMVADRFDVARHGSDPQQMLADIQPDVVHVATPPSAHASIARHALESGAHVFVEKPITTSLNDLRDLQALACERNLQLVEDHNYRFNPTVRRLETLREAGFLGEIVHVEITICLDILGPGSRLADPHLGFDPSVPGGAIGDFLTHLAYLTVRWVGPHRSVHTMWRKRAQHAPVPADEMRALVDAEAGTAFLTFSAHASPDLFRLRVFGSRARAEADLFESRTVISRATGAPRPFIPVRNGLAEAVSDVRAAFGGLFGKLGGRPGGYSGLHELIRLFYDALDRGTPMPVTPDDILATNRLVHAIGAEAPS